MLTLVNYGSYFKVIHPGCISYQVRLKKHNFVQLPLDVFAIPALYMRHNVGWHFHQIHKFFL